MPGQGVSLQGGGFSLKEGGGSALWGVLHDNNDDDVDMTP